MMLNMMTDIFGIKNMVKDFATSWLLFLPCVFQWATPNVDGCATSWLLKRRNSGSRITGCAGKICGEFHQFKRR